jgi:hypothetical protein
MDGSFVTKGLTQIIAALFVIMAPWSTAYASARGSYLTDVVIQEPVGEVHRGALALEVFQCLQSTKIQRVAIDGTTIGQFERQQLDQNQTKQLPLPVLQALRLACTNAPIRTYWNVLLPQLSGDAIPSALFRPDKHHLDVRIGTHYAPSAFESAPTEAELRRRYGIGPLGSYGRKWEAAQRVALDQALASLMLEERQYIRDIPFERRSHSGFQSRQKHVADYFQRGAVASIYLYDKAFEHDEKTAFAGTPERPALNSAFGILHEVGHLIAAAPSLRRYRQAEVLQRAYDGLYQKYEAAYAEHAAAVKQYNNAREHRAPLAARVTHTEKILKEYEPRLEASINSTRAASRAGLRLQGNSPVVMEYKKIRSNRSGPTSYGRTDPSEGFAEAFAIFHLDPQALEWIDPEVYQWFRMGRHLEPMQRQKD